MANNQTAVPDSLSSDWLTIDTTAAERGYGPAVYGGSSEPAPVVPTAVNPLPLDQPTYVTDAEDLQYDSEGVGAWPYLPDASGLPIQRQQGPSQGLTESLQPSAGDYRASGFWGDSEPLQTYDYVYQQTDAKGYYQNVPNDRVSSRKTWGQANPDNNPTWYPYGERPVTSHIAVRPVSFTTDDSQFGTIGFSSGSLPDWSMTGGQGNTAYETPGPPPVTQVQASPVITQESGWA